MRKFKHLYCVLAVASVCGAAPGQAAATPPLQLDIPAQPMADALNEFARQSGLQVLVDWKDSSGLTSPRMVGVYSAQQALTALLADSGLRFEYLDERTIAVRKVASKERSSPGTGALHDSGAWTMRLAQADGGSATGNRVAAEESASRSEAGADSLKVEEIVVTAQKRLERLLDVPVPVTAVAASSLLESNQSRLQDYYTRIPGLAFTPRGGGEPTIAIRGISADYGANPAVGITIDDVPYGASTGLGGGLAAPDFDPSDLSRIEVLRGPQGTLYGASSLGGLLKFVTTPPSTDRVSGHLQGTLSSVGHSDELGYSGRGGFNLPLGENFAIRASGFKREDAGYIDNVRTGEDDINNTEAHGGRLAGLWRISDDTSLRLGALYQQSELEGSNFVDLLPGLADLEQNKLAGTGRLDRKARFYTAALDTKVGELGLSALSGYAKDDYQSSMDIGIALDNLRRNTKFSQEIRLSSPTGERFEWLAGAYYTHEKTPSRAALYLVDPATGRYTSELFLLPFEMTLEEYAAFADLTVHFTDRFDVQFGGRQSWIEQDYTQGTDQPGHSQADAFTYMVTPRFKVSSDLMVYARFASGYRPGGPNTNTTLTGAPAQYDPDETVNYEIGVKGSVLDRALNFEALVYHIDWKDLQLVISTGTFTFFTNAGKAKSDGVELSVDATPIEGLRLGGWMAYNNAELTENFPPALVALNLAGQKGDRVPDSAEWSAHFSVDQDFALPFSAVGTVGAMVSYVGDRRGAYVRGGAPRQLYPHYTQVDFTAGVRRDAWTVNLFANNLTDERAVLTTDAAVPTSIVYSQPRTIGVSVARTF